MRFSLLTLHLHIVSRIPWVLAHKCDTTFARTRRKFHRRRNSRFLASQWNQINHKAVMGNIQDPESRGTMIFAWWMACISDAYASAYYRRKPVLDDHDYDIDFYTVDPVNADLVDTHTVMPSPREQLEVRIYSLFHVKMLMPWSVPRKLSD